MSVSHASRKGLVALIVAMCLMPLSHPTAVGSGAAQGGGCGPSTQGLDRLKADLGLDSGLANRANSFASSALRNGQPPDPNALKSLTDDSLDGLNDAGDQLDQAVSELSKQLDGMNLPRQQRLWSQSVTNLKTARTTLKSALRQDPVARGQKIGSLSPTGVGPTTLYEAASSYQSAVENLGGSTISFDQAGQTGSMIRPDQNGWMDVAKGQGQISNGSPDTAPPPNPAPDPWQEWLKRLRAQQARIHNSVNGLNAAQAMRAGDFRQAQQNAAEMQKAIQGAQNMANQLGQMVAACNQAMNQRPSQSNQPSQPTGTQAAASRGAPVGGGGSGAGAAVAGVVIVGAGVGGYALYKAYQCKEPDVQSEETSCLHGSCSACRAAMEKLVPYCDCAEKQHPEAGGLGDLCRQAVAQMQNAERLGCDLPTNFSPIPAPAAIR